MQTLWPGLAVPTVVASLGEASLVSSRAKSLRVILSDTPGVVTQLTLPATAWGLQFWTTDALIWYSVDALPGPIPPPLPDLIVPADAFAVGGVLVPSLLQVVTLPDDTLTHRLYVVSQTASPTLLVTCLVEAL